MGVACSFYSLRGFIVIGGALAARSCCNIKKVLRMYSRSRSRRRLSCFLDAQTRSSSGNRSTVRSAAQYLAVSIWHAA